jgi:hypothetical protein
VTRRALRALVGIACAGALAGGAESADAGVFQLRSCMAAKSEDYDSGAFAGTRSSTRMVVKRGCNPFGAGERGLITANKVGRRRLRQNEHASVVLWTPPGTRIVRLDWSGKLKRTDCGFTVELYAIRPGNRPAYIKRARAGRDCPRGTKANASYAPPRRYNLGGATALVQRVICRSRSGCSASRLTMMATRYATAYVADFTAPAIRILGGGLASGRWVRGVQYVNYTARDNVGIRTGRLFVGGRQVARAARPCNYSRPGPCPNGSGQLGYDTRNFALEGRQPFVVAAEDASGNANYAAGTALIDNTPPARVDVSVAGGEGWRRTNSFALTWTNPPERYAPIIAAFTRLCGTPSGPCSDARYARPGIHTITGLRVPSPGVWKLSIWRQDAAGNADPGRASVPVAFRYDPDPPRLAFEAATVADPTRVAVLVSDPVSGLARGEIELRRQGTSVWQTLATRREGNGLVAHVDDSRLPSGTYDLRGRAFDQAGNEASTTSRYDGSPMVLRLPIRFESVLRAGIAQKRAVRKRVRKGHHHRVITRRIVKLVPAARVRLGQRVRVAGRLTNADGQAVPDATIYVYSRSAAIPESLAGVVSTDASGRFSYTASGTSSRTLRFLYVGTRLALPAQRSVVLRVPAGSSLHVNRRKARNGQAVAFRGRVLSLPIPTTGKLVEIQAHFRGHWRTFSTVRSDLRGRWRFSYRFGGTVSRVRYRFRALLPAEGSYPFETGRSRTVSVTVNGRAG